jgi:hypothetical protein
MLTEPTPDTRIDDRREPDAISYSGAQPGSESLTYQQQFLRALAQGMPWKGRRLPLSFQPSPYRVRVKDSNFFAASALECLQLPALLGEDVDVTSICPSDGSAIHLTVTTQGVGSHDPPGCVVSVALHELPPGNGSSCLANNLTDPRNLARQQTRFFSSAEAAALWLVAYPNVAVLSLDQAWRLAVDLDGRLRRRP